MARLFSVKTAERTAWSMVGLAFLLVLLFFMLHIASGAPVVGPGANALAMRASGASYGY